MSWLNWSLKLHIRLRTISSLVPTHITHVYIQWMPYSFVWLYFIKCVTLTQSYVDQTKKDFEYFNFFWEVFFVLKNFKNYATLFWWLTFVGQASRETLVPSLLRSSHDSLASQTPTHEKDLEKFQKFRVFIIFATQFGDWFENGSSSHEFTQNASWLPLWLTHEWTFQLRKTLRSVHEKHLDKFFKFCDTGLWRLARNLFQSRKTRVLHK